MVKRIEEVDKLKPDEKKMVFTFLDAFITKTKLQALLSNNGLQTLTK